jgi:hypothetical protein
MENNSNYQKKKSLNEISEQYLINDDDKSEIWPCELTDYFMSFSRDRDVTFDGKYKISEIAYSNQISLEVGFLNPYQEKFQNLMQISFEAGLMKAWKLFLKERNFSLKDLEENSENNEKLAKTKEILDLNSFIPIFVILLIGYFLAGFGLLAEVFYFDFIEPYKKYRKNYKKGKIKIFFVRSKD